MCEGARAGRGRVAGRTSEDIGGGTFCRRNGVSLVLPGTGAPRAVSDANPAGASWTGEENRNWKHRRTPIRDGDSPVVERGQPAACKSLPAERVPLDASCARAQTRQSGPSPHPPLLKAESAKHEPAVISSSSIAFSGCHSNPIRSRAGERRGEIVCFKYQ